MEDAREEVRTIVQAFASEDAGRSVLVESFRGVPVRERLRAETPRPAASLLKLAVVGAVERGLDEGVIDGRSEVRLGDLPETSMRSVLAAFEPDRTLSMTELCRLCLLTSDNPIAEHLLEVVGADGVNRYLRSLGCHATRLAVGFSDPELGEGGYPNVTTAQDALAMMFALAGRAGALATALENNLRATRIPLRLPPAARAPNKTGSLPGVVNDVGVIFGEGTDLGVAFLCEGQADAARTSMDIGDCVAALRLALGEVARPPLGLGPASDETESSGPRRGPTASWSSRTARAPVL